MESGVYFGWAGLYDASRPADSDGAKPRVYSMAMSVGWNPVYKNTVRSVVSVLPAVSCPGCPPAPDV